MPAAATISVARFEEAVAKMGFTPRPSDPSIFERRTDNLMFFPDIQNGRIVLVDIFQHIQQWQGGQQLADEFLNALMEVGGLD